MKKNKILIFILILIMPVFVLADGASPGAVNYEVIVKNKKGINTYDEDCDDENVCKYTKSSKISYGEKLRVVYELEKKDKYFFAEVELCKSSDEYDEEDEDECENYIINLNDVETTKKVININEEEYDEDYVFEYLVLEAGVMYKGPSTKYDIVKDSNNNNIVIPFGTKLKGYEKEINWSYVSYKGYSGWIYALYNDNLPKLESPKLAYVNKNKSIILENYNAEVFNSNEKIEIPGGTQFDEYYDSEFDGVGGSYVKYNDKYLKVGSSLFEEVKKEYRTTTKINVYDKWYWDFSYCDTSKSKKNAIKKYNLNVVSTIEEGEVITIDYIYINSHFAPDDYSAWYYIDNNGIKGYIYDPESYDKCHRDDDEYDSDYSGDLVSLDDEEDDDYEEDEDYEEEITDDETIEEDNKEEQYNYEENQNEEDDSDDNNSDEEVIIIEKKKISQEELIYICIGGSIILILTSIVIIKLVNKKKNTQVVNNENNNITNNSETQQVINNNNEQNQIENKDESNNENKNII